MPFRVRLLGRASFWPHQLVQSSAESTTGEVSLAFGHAMEVRLSRRLRSSVPPITLYKACLLLVMVEVFIVLLARNCNIYTQCYLLKRLISCSRNMKNTGKYFKLHVRLSEKSFVLFIQYPADEGLFLLDWRQF